MVRGCEGEAVGAMSDDMAWDLVYQLALEVAGEHGATIPESARAVGVYNFLQRVRTSEHGFVLIWDHKPA